MVRLLLSTLVGPEGSSRAAAGRTNRFDEALHLVLDQLERNLL